MLHRSITSSVSIIIFSLKVKLTCIYMHLLVVKRNKCRRDEKDATNEHCSRHLILANNIVVNNSCNNYDLLKNIYTCCSHIKKMQMQVFWLLRCCSSIHNLLKWQHTPVPLKQKIDDRWWHISFSYISSI